MVYGMACQVWYSLADMACYMVWPCGHGVVYGLAGGACVIVPG